MITHLFISSSRGDVIALKQYRDDISGNISEIFFEKIKDCKGSHPTPVLDAGGYSFLFLRQNGLYFVCTTTFNISPCLVFEMLTRLTTLLKDYCGVLNEESLRLNFVLVYELLDEVIDFGYIQGTSTEQLKRNIYNQAIAIGTEHTFFDTFDRVIGLDSKRKVQPSLASSKPISLTGESMKFRKNEVYIDVLEKLTVLVAATGELIRSEINGSIQIKSYLTGSPEVHITLNDDIVIGRPESNMPVYGSVVLDHCSFHDAVNLTQFELSRTLIVHPPDGEFVAMKYRITSEPVNACIFKLNALFEEKDSKRLDLTLRLSSVLPSIHYATSIIATIPLAKATNSVSFELSNQFQSAAFDTTNKLITWKIKRLDSGAEQTIKLKMMIPEMSRSVRKEIGPFSLDFEVPVYLTSGLEIRHLKAFDTNRSNVPLRWIRYVTYGDSYVIRI